VFLLKFLPICVPSERALVVVVVVMMMMMMLMI
jgi:hypothetical protein